MVIGFLYLSEQRGWFEFNHRKGYTVVFAVAVSAIGLLLFSGCALASQFTKWKLQFSLATLMLMVPVLGIPSAWLAREMEQARQQREAIDAIEERDGQVHFDKHDHDSLISTCAMPLLGRTFFDDVKKVEWEIPSDDDLAYLKPLSNLKELNVWIDGTGLTDTGLECLEGMTQLHDLSLSDTHVTGAGLSHLKRLAQLKQLKVSYNGLTDGDAKYLMELKQLEELYLYGTKITEEGLTELRSALPGCIVNDGVRVCQFGY